MILLGTEQELLMLIENKVLEPLERNGMFNFRMTLPNKRTLEFLVQVRSNGDPIGNVIKNEKIEDWIDEWRQGFKGKKVGAMGDRKRLIANMKRLLNEYPQYTKEDVFKARDAYFKFNMERWEHYNFVREAHYFVRKEILEEGKKVIVEDILKFLENPEDYEQEQGGNATREKRQTRKF